MLHSNHRNQFTTYLFWSLLNLLLRKSRVDSKHSICSKKVLFSNGEFLLRTSKVNLHLRKLFWCTRHGSSTTFHFTLGVAICSMYTSSFTTLGLGAIIVFTLGSQFVRAVHVSTPYYKINKTQGKLLQNEDIRCSHPRVLLHANTNLVQQW